MWLLKAVLVKLPLTQTFGIAIMTWLSVVHIVLLVLREVVVILV